MTLAELMQRINQLDGALAIYATPRWASNSDVVVAREPHDGSLPKHAAGKTFLVTVGEARRVIEGRRRLRPGCALSADELAGAVVYYAVYDESEPIGSMASAEIHLSYAV